jgi:hypothetical protein
MANQKKQPPPPKFKDTPLPPKRQPKKNLSNPIDANERPIDVRAELGQ